MSLFFFFFIKHVALFCPHSFDQNEKISFFSLYMSKRDVTETETETETVKGPDNHLATLPLEAVLVLERFNRRGIL